MLGDLETHNPIINSSWPGVDTLRSA